MKGILKRCYNAASTAIKAAAFAAAVLTACRITQNIILTLWRTP